MAPDVTTGNLWLAACANPHIVVKRCDRHLIRLGALELGFTALLHDPVPHVRRLMAALGEAHDDLLIRHLIENYPGAAA